MNETQYFIDDIYLDLERLTFQSEEHLVKAEKIHNHIKYLIEILKKIIIKNKKTPENFKMKFSLLKPETPIFKDFKNGF